MSRGGKRSALQRLGDRSRRRRDTRCSPTSDSSGCSFVPRNEVRIVEARLEIDEPGEMREPVPRPRLPRRMSGLPASSSGFGLPMSGGNVLFAMPPRSNAREVFAGLEDLPARQRNELRQRAARDLLRGRRLRGQKDLRVAVAVVAFAEKCALLADQSIRVADRGPEDRARGHRAARDGGDLRRMTAAAGLRATRRSPGFMKRMNSGDSSRNPYVRGDSRWF